MSTALPPVAELIPHQGDLVLLEHIEDAGEAHLHARLTVRADGLYNHGDRVPAWVGLEYMSQAVAALGGLRARQRRQPVTPGFLLGTRRYQCDVPYFTVGASLRVSVSQVLGEDTGMAVFDCLLSGEGIHASARLNVYRPAPQTDGATR
ncbi:ApeP family dehydratase [Alloalcanivorax mobilis]|uniref:ApeP family dehydratase n=1 Tax=Alloalcanivorax mobilis TaxID=2019569 RepID=UPI000C7929A2|nr:hotdog family protein [Alloalcanivorax mobilis]